MNFVILTGALIIADTYFEYRKEKRKLYLVFMFTGAAVMAVSMFLRGSGDKAEAWLCACLLALYFTETVFEKKKKGGGKGGVKDKSAAEKEKTEGAA